MEDNPSRKKAKYEHHQRCPKPRHNNTGTTVKNNPDGVEDEYNPDQPAFKQAGQATDGYLERNNYMPPSEDEVSLGDDEFGIPEDPIEQEHFKRRLIATSRSLKKKQQQLQADQDLLTDRWIEVLTAEEYGLEPPTKGYPKHKLLPQLDEEAVEPTLPAQGEADRPPRGRDKMAYQAEY